MQRSYDVLGEYRAMMDELERRARAARGDVGGARRAQRRGVPRRGAHARTGVDARILERPEEAALSYAGATAGLAADAALDGDRRHRRRVDRTRRAWSTARLAELLDAVGLRAGHRAGAGQRAWSTPEHDAAARP